MQSDDIVVTHIPAACCLAASSLNGADPNIREVSAFDSLHQQCECYSGL